MSWIFGMSSQKANLPNLEQPSQPPTTTSSIPQPPLPSTTSPLLLSTPQSAAAPLPTPTPTTPPQPPSQQDTPGHPNQHLGPPVIIDNEIRSTCLELTKMIVGVAVEQMTKENFKLSQITLQKDCKIKQLEEQIYALKLDLFKKKTEELAEEKRRNFVQDIKTKFTTKCVAFENGVKEFGNGIKGFMADHKTMINVAGTVTAFSAGWYIAKWASGVGARYSRFAQPSLIRETSRHSITQILRHPIRSSYQFLHFKVDPLMNFQFSPYLESRFRDIRSTTYYTNFLQGDYKNVYYFGPPEIGKTLLAKGLAFQTGLDYAIIDGGDVAAKGKEGASAINEVFDWAKSSRKGLVLYIDNADAFLNQRSTDLSSKNRSAILNAVYSRTLFRSDKFMLGVASQKQEHIDLSLHESMDQHVELELPNRAERESLFLQYFEYYFEPAYFGNQDIKIVGLNWREKMKEIAIETHGISRHEISKLVYNWRASASKTQILTEKMINSQTADAMRVNQYCTKSRFTNVDNVKSYSRESLIRKINFIDFLLTMFIIFVIPFFVALVLSQENKTKREKKCSS